MPRILSVSTLAAFAFASSLVPPAAAEPTLQQLRIIAPAAPGGGWDQTARAMQHVLQRAGIVRTAPVENIPGAAGTIGLARFIGAERARGDALMVSGLIMLGGIVTHLSPVTLHDVTPVARLTGEYEVIAVPAASPLKTVDDLIRALRERPEAVSWGGGSAGGSDQILAGLFAQAVGVAPARINYIAFSGGGESLSAILGGQVSVGVNGLAEFAPHMESGALRALAISSTERLDGVDAPTLREQGVDVAFENWRSVVAPPGLTAADRQRLEMVIETMVRSPEWREELSRYRWLDRYQPAAEFARFSGTEEARVGDILRAFKTDRSSTGIAGTGPYPWLVLGGLGLCALAMIVKADWSALQPGTQALVPVALIAAGAVLDLLLAERAGFVIASAVLFFCTAQAFDTRRAIRNAVLAVAVSVASYVLFSHGLQLALPGGILARWL